jgi:hypothetical protein
MITKTFKVYNKVTLKSVNISGYHMIKSLTAQGATKADLMYIKGNIKKFGFVGFKNLTIDAK